MADLVPILREGGGGGGIGKTFMTPTPSPRSYAPPPATANREALRDAREMGLTARPRTSGANGLTDAMVRHVIAHTPRKNARRPATIRKVRLAVGAVLGDLLACWAKDPPAMTFRASKEGTFTGEAVSYTYFRMTLDGLRAAGLVHRHGGIRYARSEMDPSDGKAARYWPTERLLDAAEGHGLAAVGLDAHFAHEFPARPPAIPQPVLLRPFQSYGRQRSNAVPPDQRNPAARAIREEVEAFNAFASTFDVQGCRPPRFRRMFTGRLDLHGRWYAAGSVNYQGLNKRSRGRLTIDGQPVVELDVRASFLTILHGLCGVPIPESDLYDIPDVPRDVAKAAVVSTLGKGSSVRRWSVGTLRRTPACAEHSAPKVAAALATRYPFLLTLGDVVAHLPDTFRASRGVVSAYLMGVEANAMTVAMGYIREHGGALALPVHDSLIVPESAEAIAREGIAEGFRRFAKVVPVVVSQVVAATDFPFDAAR